MRRHWRVAAFLVFGAALVFAGSVYVFLWFVGNAESSGQVPITLGLWTTSHLVTFILYAVFWEPLPVGIPIVIAVVMGWQWWKDCLKLKGGCISADESARPAVAEDLYCGSSRSASRSSSTEDGMFPSPHSLSTML